MKLMLVLAMLSPGLRLFPSCRKESMLRQVKEAAEAGLSHRTVKRLSLIIRSKTIWHHTLM